MKKSARFQSTHITNSPKPSKQDDKHESERIIQQHQQPTQKRHIVHPSQLHARRTPCLCTRMYSMINSPTPLEPTYIPESLRAERPTLPTLPLVFLMPALSAPRWLSARLTLPRTLLSVVDPDPDFMMPGVLGRGDEPMFSISLLLSLSIDE